MSRIKTSGFFWKLMAAYSLVIIGVLLFTGAAFYVFTSRYLENEAGENMARAAELTSSLIRRDQASAVLYSRLLSDNYQIKSLVKSRDSESVSGILESELNNLGADFVSLAGPAGVVFSHVTRKKETGETAVLSGSEPLFLSRVFKRVEENRAGSAGIEPLFPQTIGVVAIAPIIDRTTPCYNGENCGNGKSVSIMGYVRIGYYLDERFIQRIKDMTGSDIAIMHRGAVFSSTFEIPGGGELMDYDVLASDYMIRSEPVLAGGNPVAHIVTLYLRDRFQKVQRQGLSVIAIIGFVAFIGFIAASAWMARKITEPLGELARGVNLVEEGRMDYRIPYVKGDEIGSLAESFNRMTEALLKREKELRRNQEQLIESGKLAAVGELAAGVAHEIGNPLAAISGYLQLLRESEPEKVDHYIEELIKEVGFIDSIIRQLLDFSRPARQTREEVNLDDVVDEAMKMISFHNVVKTVEINRERSGEPAVAVAGRKEIIQAVMNLVLNAAQAMDGHGTVSVKTRVENRDAVVEVSDTGPGIKEENIARIFDPFYTTKRGGTGLGLSITFRIIDVNGGKLTVESPPGGGAVFRITLPLAE